MTHQTKGSLSLLTSPWSPSGGAISTYPAAFSKRRSQSGTTLTTSIITVNGSQKPRTHSDHPSDLGSDVAQRTGADRLSRVHRSSGEADHQVQKQQEQECDANHGDQDKPHFRDVHLPAVDRLDERL